VYEVYLCGHDGGDRVLGLQESRIGLSSFFICDVHLSGHDGGDLGIKLQESRIGLCYLELHSFCVYEVYLYGHGGCDRGIRLQESRTGLCYLESHSCCVHDVNLCGHDGGRAGQSDWVGGLRKSGAGRIGMAMGRRREGGGEESSEGRLLEMCIRAACRDMKSVRAWRQKRRTLELLPSELAERLFHRLLQAHLLSPPLIELVPTTSIRLACILILLFPAKQEYIVYLRTLVPECN
jgi:hypothetical protein